MSTVLAGGVQRKKDAAFDLSDADVQDTTAERVFRVGAPRELQLSFKVSF